MRQDPLSPLFQPCLLADDCGTEGLSPEDFPFLTAEDEPEPSFGDQLLLGKWLWQALLFTAIVALVAWLQDRGTLPEPFDGAVFDYISGLAIGTFVLAAYQFYAQRSIDAVADHELIRNAATSFAHDLAAAFTIARARRFVDATVTIPVYPGECGEIVGARDVTGGTLLCHLALLVQTSMYGVTFFLSDEGIVVDKLPLKYDVLRNEVAWFTSRRNRNELSTIMRMAGRIVQYMVDAGAIPQEVWEKAVSNIGAYNSAIGALELHATLRINRFSNAWLRKVIFVTSPFIILSTPFSLGIKILLGFFLAVAIFYTLALRIAEADITNLDNPLASIRLRDLDDGAAYAAAVEIAGIAELANAGQRASVPEFAGNFEPGASRAPRLAAQWRHV